MRTFTLIAILTCAVLVIFHAAAAEELEAQDVIETEALATLDEERLFECSFSCDIKKNGKPCKGSGEKKCSGGWRCKMNFCVKV
uniref:U3-theraphotoxin-Cg1a n=1 Tax=Chilobrachys guangxiensis TaxID=278060 RepID=JZT8A_CHIGU|nr:RecName: Full=U3-theraphotoxin-Cg1a; Short=U3-TRTX-Cg1a; AltName: Full=Jingzhaotoxin-8; Short=JZTX-8; AltName: Full=Jingzhaotoxin-VIII; Short=JZTX-VIII; AltName: Full=Peptide F7-12.17; Flags: Precursor [Chilobrachys guangxiensis]ABY71656.1 cystine knot toxin [Chilobrachys guangxiensis]